MKKSDYLLTILNFRDLIKERFIDNPKEKMNILIN
jgi:hypothetical protein